MKPMNGHYFYKDGVWRKVRTDSNRLYSIEGWYKDDLLHREDGPSFINRESYEDRFKIEFSINGADITLSVFEWIRTNNYPSWINEFEEVVDEDPWNDEIKLHFKLTFG